MADMVEKMGSLKDFNMQLIGNKEKKRQLKEKKN